MLIPFVAVVVPVRRVVVPTEKPKPDAFGDEVAMPILPLSRIAKSVVEAELATSKVRSVAEVDEPQMVTRAYGEEVARPMR
jgi:hypothetical protein